MEQGPTKQAILQLIIDNIEQTYLKFLIQEKLVDVPVIRAGFLEAAEHVIERDPIPDAYIQRELVKHLAMAKMEATEQYLEQVELTFIEMCRTRGEFVKS